MRHNLLLTDKLKLEIRALPLEFANTADWHASAQPIEKLTSYADLLAWAHQIEILSEADVRRLTEQAEQTPAVAEATLEQAIELREAIYHIFSAISAGGVPQPTDMDTLNDSLSETYRRIQLVRIDADYCYQLTGMGDRLEQVLWTVAYATAELLASSALDQVKECEDDRGCGLLFLDTSKNRTRRWCSMRSCGNRAKVRRHRQQKQQAG